MSILINVSFIIGALLFFILIIYLMKKTGIVRTLSQDKNFFSYLAKVAIMNYSETDTIELREKLVYLFSKNSELIQPINVFAYKKDGDINTYFFIADTSLPKPYSGYQSPSFSLCLFEYDKLDDFELLIVPKKYLFGNFMRKYYAFVQNLQEITFVQNENFFKDYIIFSNNPSVVKKIINEKLTNIIRNANIKNLAYHRKSNICAIYTINYLEKIEDFIELKNILNNINQNINLSNT